MSGIVPSRLHRVKLFESTHVYRRVDGGQLLEQASPTIEEQINAWIDETKSLVVSTGPLMLTSAVTAEDVVTEIRTLSIVYVSAVEQNEALYGDRREITRKMGSLPEPVVTGSPASAAAISDGPNRKRGEIRVPKVRVEGFPGCREGAST